MGRRVPQFRRLAPAWLYALWAAYLLGASAAAQEEEPVVTAPPPDDPALFAGSELHIDYLEEAITQREPLLLRPVGSTSVVFRIRLAGDVDAAFKPRTRSHPRGDLAEVAAYRIGRFLGMNNIAPAVQREMSLETLRAQLMSDYEARWEELSAAMLPAGDGRVRGAAIYWIPNLRDLGFDTERGIKRWSRWLGQDGTPPYRDKSKRLARQISNMVVFDYLIANWDRFSGANAQGDARGYNLLVRDHNVAFYHPLPPGQHRKLLDRLRRVQRFSLSFVERLKAMDAAALDTLLHHTDDPEGYEPLKDAQKRDVLHRRDALLSYVAALIDQHGADRVLVFP